MNIKCAAIHGKDAKMIIEKIKNKRTKRILRFIGLLMFVIAVSFIYYALNHPESSWPFRLELVYFMYLCYVIIMIACIIISFL